MSAGFKQHGGRTPATPTTVYGFEVAAGVGAGFGLIVAPDFGAGAAKNGGIVEACAASDGPLGFNKRNSCMASPAQKLVRCWVKIASQIRRASSVRFFVFRMYTCESRASGALKLFG